MIQETDRNVVAAMVASAKVAMIGPKNAGTKTVIRCLLQGRNPLRISTLENDTQGFPATSYLVHSLKYHANDAVKSDGQDHDNSHGAAITARHDLIELLAIEFPDNAGEDRETMKEFVSTQWNSFDCVVVVLDISAQHGTIVQHQFDLLAWIKTVLAVENIVPVVILGNKIDALDSDEGQLDDACNLVTSVFQVSSRQVALQDLLKIIELKETAPNNLLQPVFVPISALYADAMQILSSKYQRVHDPQASIPIVEATMNRIGQQELGGREWRKVKSMEEKCQLLWDRVFDDPEAVSSGVWANSLQPVRAILSYCLYDRMTQRPVLEQQLKKALERVDWENSNVPLADQIRSIASKQAKLLHQNYNLGSSAAAVQEAIGVSPIIQVFWEAYEKCENAALQAFDSPGHVEKLWAPLEQLLRMGQWLQEEDTLFAHGGVYVGWAEQEKVQITNRMKLLLRRQFGVVFREFNSWYENFDHDGWSTRANWNGSSGAAGEIPSWNVLTPPEWDALLRELLTPLQSHVVLGLFPNEVIILNQAVDRVQYLWNKPNVPDDFCPNCKVALDVRSRRCSSCKQFWNKPWYSPDVDQCFGCLMERQVSHKMINGRCSENRDYLELYWQPHPGNFRWMAMEYNVETGEMVPPAKCKQFVCAQLLPSCLSNPKHFGHGVWKLAEYLKEHEKLQLQRFLQQLAGNAK